MFTHDTVTISSALYFETCQFCFTRILINNDPFSLSRCHGPQALTVEATIRFPLMSITSWCKLNCGGRVGRRGGFTPWHGNATPTCSHSNMSVVTIRSRGRITIPLPLNMRLLCQKCSMSTLSDIGEFIFFISFGVSHCFEEYFAYNGSQQHGLRKQGRTGKVGWGMTIPRLMTRQSTTGEDS